MPARSTSPATTTTWRAHVLVYDPEYSDRAPWAVLTADTLFIGDVGRPDLRASLRWSAEQLGSMLYDSLHQKLAPPPDATLVYPAHGAGSLCGKNLSTEAVVLVAEPGREVEAATRLRRIAFDAVAGYLAGGMQPLDAAPELVDRIERVTARSLSEQLAAAAPPQLIDVRSPREWHERHIEQAINIPLAQLPDRLDTLPRDRPLVVHCASDYRSSIGASLIRRAGLEDVTVLVGGLAAWESATLATVGTP